MLILFLVATITMGFLVHALRAPSVYARNSIGVQQMAMAKAALIGRAAADADRPGSLPCPDINNDGLADGPGTGATCTSYIGRFPWKTLGTSDFRDASGERLWYALAPALTDAAARQPINHQKALELTVNGTPNIAAILFAPGAPLPGQNGRPSNNAADYLDGANGDLDSDYVLQPVSENFNDQVMAITRDELFTTVNRRILSEIRGYDTQPNGFSHGLRRYSHDNNTFPWADTSTPRDGIGDNGQYSGSLPYGDLILGTAYSWLNANGWLQLVSYQLAAGSSSATIGLGTATITVLPCPGTPCP